MGREMRSERRRDQRLQIEIPIHLKWRDTSGEIREEDSFTINVSTKGAYFSVEDEIHPSQTVEINMGVPNKFYGLLPSAMLKATARVVRVGPLQVQKQVFSDRTGVAVCFDMPPQLDLETPMD